jgi:hypothetical protein
MASSDGPNDLETHIRHALAERGVFGEPHTMNGSPVLGGIAEGIANWVNQRDAFMASKLHEWPSELLERASVMLAMAAIEAAKREAATPHEVLRNREGKCARKLCGYEHDGLKHRDTGHLYCAYCRRRINDTYGEDVVLSLNQQNELENK